MPRSVLAVVPLLAAIFSAADGPRARAAGPYDDLLKHTPSGANILALIDAKSAFNSELARTEQWRDKGQAGHRGLGFVPPDADHVVIVSDVNLSSTNRNYQLGIVKVSQLPSVRSLATQEGGSIDQIAGEFVVWSPRDVYYTNLSGSQFAAIYPADRQFAARWLRAVKANKTGELSPFLRKVADGAGANTITIAIDMEDAVDRNVVRLALPASPTVAKNKNLDIPTLANFVANVKGLTFTAKIGSAIDASVTLDFGFSPARYRAILPDLFREILEGQGVAIAGMEMWEAKFTESSMTLSGTLATADLKRIISLLSFPSPGGEIDPNSKGSEPTAAATRRYMSAVDSILADMKKLQNNQNYDKTATWHQKAATQLEQLSRQGVDPVAVDAALQSAKRLHAIADSLRGVPIDVNALEANAFYHTSGPSVGMMGGPWGWRPFITGLGQVDTNIPQVREQMLKVIADDQKRRASTWSQIDQIVVSARTKMVEKYKIKF